MNLWSYIWIVIKTSHRVGFLMGKNAFSFAEEHEPWNMNQAYLMGLDHWLNECSQAASDGDLLRFYRCLRIVYRMIHWKIKEPGQEIEEKDLDAKFLIAKRNFTAAQTKEIQVMSLGQNEILLDEIDMKMRDLIITYELIKLAKEQRDPNKAILEKFS